MKKFRWYLAVIVAAGVLALGLQPAGASELTPQEKATVQAAAQRDGVPAAKIKALLADRQASVAYPISFTQGESAPQRIAPAVYKQAAVAAGNSAPVTFQLTAGGSDCWSQTYWTGAGTINGVALRFYTQKYWCGNYSVVTYAPPARSWVTVYRWASAIGWHSDGVSNENTYSWWPQNGGWWASRSTATARFGFSPYRVGYVSSYTKTNNIDGYGNGASTSWRNG